MQASDLPEDADSSFFLCRELIPGYLVARDQMDPDYIRQVKAMCELLYPAKTNIDYFPTNFVVHDGELFYIDYECNDYMEEWNFENWGIKYWSKTPEFLEYYKEHM